MADQVQPAQTSAASSQQPPQQPPAVAPPAAQKPEPQFEAMQPRGFSTPLVPLPRRSATITTLERLRTPHQFGNLQGSTLAGILAQLDKGQPEDWADLVEFALATDDHLRSCYDTRITRVVQAEYQIVPNEFGDQTQAELAADLVNQQLGRVKNWRGFLKGALHAEALGYSAAEIGWGRDGVHNQVYPEVVRTVHPHRFRFDEQWVPRIYDRGARRSKGSLGSTHGLYGEALNPSGWIIHIGSGVGGYPNSAGYMRSGIWHWMFRRWVEGFYIAFIEKYGSGRAHGVVPKGATDEVRRKALEAMELWANDGYAILEDGSTLVIDAMDAATSSDTAHAQYIGYIERCHSKLILGTSDAADPGANGSQAAVGARTGATMDPRMVSDGLSLCDTLHDQLFYWICYFNRHLFDGGNVPPVPRMQFKTASDEQKTDLQDLASQNAVDGQLPPGMLAAVPSKQGVGVPAPKGEVSTEPQIPTGSAQQPAPQSSNQHPGEAPASMVKMVDPVVVPPPTPKTSDLKQALDVVRAAKAGEIGHASACRMLTHFYGLDQTTALEMVGEMPPVTMPVAAQQAPLVREPVGKPTAPAQQSPSKPPTAVHPQQLPLPELTEPPQLDANEEAELEQLIAELAALLDK